MRGGIRYKRRQGYLLFSNQSGGTGGPSGLGEKSCFEALYFRHID